MMEAAAQNVITILENCDNFATFAAEIYGDMKTTVIRIGNSKGIVIPARFLKKLGVKEKDEVSIEEKDGKLELSFHPYSEPFTGPFTGPFEKLKAYIDPEDTRDALDIAKELHDSRVNTRETPEW